MCGWTVNVECRICVTCRIGTLKRFWVVVRACSLAVVVSLVASKPPRTRRDKVERRLNLPSGPSFSVPATTLCIAHVFVKHQITILCRWTLTTLSVVHTVQADKNTKMTTLTLMRRLRHVRHPVFVRLFTSLALCRGGWTIKLGSVDEGRGMRPGIGW